jgi:hypothetical protein
MIDRPYDPLLRCDTHDEENCITCACAIIYALKQSRDAYLKRVGELEKQVETLTYERDCFRTVGKK